METQKTEVKPIRLPGPDHPTTIARNHSANAVWTYEAAHPAVAAINGHLAFYPDRVDITVDQPAG